MIFQDKQNKRQYIQTTLYAITILIKSFNNIDEELFIELLEMNIKFIQNFLIEKLVKQQSQFIQWLDIVKDFSIYLINNNQT